MEFNMFNITFHGSFFISNLLVNQSGTRGGTGPNFDGGVALVNAKTHPYLRETKGPDKPHV